MERLTSENNATFTRVTALIQQSDGTQKHMLGYRLEKGAYTLSRPNSLSFKNNDFTLYIQSKDYIIEIHPDGLIQRTTTDPIQPEYGKKDTVGYLLSSTIQNGKELIATTSQYYGGVGITPETVQLTDFPVEDVVFITSEETLSDLPITTIHTRPLQN